MQRKTKALGKVAPVRPVRPVPV